MFLKTLKVAGFKSFADRTRLEFRPGVSVVVGPNGSGKSNLVDAIHWVMGTQAPRSLRTARMEDVIFAGTATRPALNRSEVTVVFDNTTRQLALDLNEVALTRRLYRDGSSDYEINGVACRLLDITELLSDSGVGRHQHIIINQGQVDSILSAGPEEHRAVIEEAAGILKHKLRKERALRRLERTDEDLGRLTDLLSEVGRQMRPLKRQAEAAGRHDALVTEVNSLTLYLAGEEIRHLDRTLEESRSRQTELNRAIDEATEKSVELAAEASAKTATVAEIRQILERDAEAAARLETTTEQLRRVAQVAMERHRSGLSRRQGADERRKDLEEERVSLARETEETTSIRERAAAQSAEQEATFRLLEEQERSLADQADLSAEGALAVVQGEQRSMASADERDRHESNQIDHRLSVVTEQIETEASDMAGLDDEMLALDAAAGNAQRRYEAAAENSRRDQQRWESAQLEVQEYGLEAAAGEARRDALAAFASDRALDSQVERHTSSAPGALGPILGLWEVPPKWSLAVAAALGIWTDAIGFREGGHLEDLIAALKDDGGGGGVAAVTADSGRGFAALSAGPLGLLPLIDAIGAEGSEIAVSLLGDVVVVDDWKTAWAFVRAHTELRAVTADGDLITSSGIRLARETGPTIVMLEEAGKAANESELRLAKARSRNVSARREFEQTRRIEREALESLESVEARLAGITEARGRARRIASELEAERLRLEQRQELLRKIIAERQTAMDQLGPTIAALEGEESERQRLMADLNERRWQVASSKEEARASWQEAARSLSAASERLALLQSRQQVVKEELEGREGGFVSDADLSSLETIEALARETIKVILRQIDVVRERQLARREQARVAGFELSEHQSQLTRLGAEIESDRKTSNEWAITEAECRVRREAIAEALRREIDSDEQAALDAPFVDGENLADLLVQRQAELRRMGPVNPLAADEYRELEARHKFLAGQLDDLEQSRRELRRVMSALDEEIQIRFSAAFEEVAVAYQEYFTVLFPGGTGRMRLTDPGHPLASGVEIEAQPMGKKVGSLGLLSGGERSLAALAFLFGVFKARPSPFYILDEVDAALDDSNLRRFLRLIETFRSESQLILVTHQQQTMEVADVLYGVTVEPGGSSQVLSRDLATLKL